MPRRILLVCSGNTCRSPMAAALLRRMLEARLGPAAADVVVTSAGTSAVEGVGPSVQAVMVLAERGLDLSGHKARAVSRALLDGHDLILAMTRHHRALLEEVAPEAAGKLFTLKEYARHVTGGGGRPAGAAAGPSAATADGGSGEFPGEPGSRPDDPELDIADPFGGAFEAYQATARELEAALRPVADAIAAEVTRAGRREPGGAAEPEVLPDAGGRPEDGPPEGGGLHDEPAEEARPTGSD